MKPTQVTELLANIKKTFVSFFSIMMFVALGVGIFTGISWSGTALQKAAGQMHEEGNFHNFQIQYPYGLTKDDIAALSEVEGVTDVEGERETVRTLFVDGKPNMVKVQTIGERIDVPIVIEGTLPEANDEIALKASSAANMGIHVGDVIEFSPVDVSEYGLAPDSALGDVLMSGQMKNNTFTVTAIVESPEYIARWTPIIGYTLVGATDVDGVAWVTDDAFDDGAYAFGYSTVNVVCDDLNDMNTFSSSYASQSQEIEDRIVALGEPRAEARYNELHTAAEEGVTVGEARLEALSDEVALYEGLPDDTVIVIDGVETTLGEARHAVAEGDSTLAVANEELPQMKNYPWTVSARSYNSSVMEASTLSGVAKHLSLSMAMLFIIVGLLVSYSAVSRIVHEQVIEIGTKKALGFRASEITKSFLAYAAIAVAVGAIIGIIVAILLVEHIIGDVLGARFIMGDYAPYFGLPLALGVTAVEMALVLGATWIACQSVLKRQATELLRGERPPESRTRFYEEWKVWDRLPLFTQTIVNNCINDKRRMFSTIVGVAGCTALIVTAVTLNKDVLKSYDLQYENVYSYNAIVWLDGNEKDAEDAEDAESAESAAENVEAALRDEGCTTAQVMREMLFVDLPDGERSYGYIVVPEDAAEFSDVYHINPTKGSADFTTDGGVWVTRAYATHIGAEVGDEIVLSSLDGSEYRLPITGFYEYYLSNFEVVIDRDTYEQVFETEYASNTILADTHGQKVSDVRKAIESTPGYGGITNDKSSQKGAFDSFSEVSRTVVFIYLILAVLMAVVVLLNLNVMFIQEKKRELIVLMINGFSIHDAKRYIYNDTFVLTIVGIVCGLVLGVIMGAVTVASIELDSAVFFRGISWVAVLAGAVVSAVLSFLMSVIALRMIPSFKLTDINKV